MREIKFRGKRVDNGEWVEGDFTRRKSRFVPYLDTTYGISDEFGTFHAVDLETVGQFTGLHDKSGKDIYEGDICHDARGFRFVVIWEENARFVGRGIGKQKEYIRYVGQEPAVKDIGNIYDNPELLEGTTSCQTDT